MPCCVSSWPSQTANIVPAAMPTTMVRDDNRLEPEKPQLVNIGTPPPNDEFSSVAWPTAYTMASGMVR